MYKILCILIAIITTYQLFNDYLESMRSKRIGALLIIPLYIITTMHFLKTKPDLMCIPGSIVLVNLFLLILFIILCLIKGVIKIISKKECENNLKEYEKRICIAEMILERDNKEKYDVYVNLIYDADIYKVHNIYHATIFDDVYEDAKIYLKEHPETTYYSLDLGKYQHLCTKFEFMFYISDDEQLKRRFIVASARHYNIHCITQ